MTFEFVTHSPEETIALGEKIGKRLAGGDIVAYTGGLGAGKTTITRGLCVGMGLADEVTSPTFTLVNEYTGSRIRLCHFDMYRINGGADLETTGFFDYMDEDTVLAVEWSENIADELTGDVIRINIERVDDDTRRITLDGDERFADIGDGYQR